MLSELSMKRAESKKLAKKRCYIAVAMCNVAEVSQNTYPEFAFSNLTCSKCSDQSYINLNCYSNTLNLRQGERPFAPNRICHFHKFNRHYLLYCPHRRNVVTMKITIALPIIEGMMGTFSMCHCRNGGENPICDRMSR